MRHLVLFSAVALAVTPVASAFAQTAPQAEPKKVDPNEIVCEKQEDTGSRLSSHRICKTRAEWAEERRTNRMDVDKMQTQRGTESPH